MLADEVRHRDPSVLVELEEGAVAMDEWTTNRLSGEALRRLAES